MTILLGGYRYIFAFGAKRKLDRVGVWGRDFGRCLKIFWLFWLVNRSSMLRYTVFCNHSTITYSFCQALLSLGLFEIILNFPDNTPDNTKTTAKLYCFETSCPLRFQYLKTNCTFSRISQAYNGHKTRFCLLSHLLQPKQKNSIAYKYCYE
jgi:hypothetical protein